MNQACPNCGVALAAMPARKTNCKACGLPMYVKSTPGDRTKRLMTEAQAEAAEAAWDAYNERGRLDSIADNAGLPAGLDAAALRARLRAIAGDQGAEPHARKMAALAMRINFAGSVEERLSWEAIVQRMQLEEYRQSGAIEEVRIQTDDAECPACVRLGGRRLSLQEATETMPLPDPQCPRLVEDRGACRCWYRSIVAGWDGKA